MRLGAGTRPCRRRLPLDPLVLFEAGLVLGLQLLVQPVDMPDEFIERHGLHVGQRVPAPVVGEEEVVRLKRVEVAERLGERTLP